MTEVEIPQEVKDSYAAATAEGHDVEYVVIQSRYYVYRSILRNEWRALLKARNEAILLAKDDELKKAEIMDNEFEQLLAICLVYSQMPVDKIPAGAVQILAESIMALSGFGGPDEAPKKL